LTPSLGEKGGEKAHQPCKDKDFCAIEMSCYF
jgi:hypothetical protein